MGTTAIGVDLSNAGEATKREDAGIDVPIFLPDGRPALYVTGPAAEGQEPPTTQVIVRVAGSYSTRYQRALDAQRAAPQQYTAPHAMGQRATALQIELTAACILSWQGIGRDGQLIDCTIEQAIELLTLARWIRDQLDFAIHHHAAFFATGSSA